MSRSMPAVHLCRFTGKRTDEKPPKRTRCEFDQCRSRATVVVIFAWGAAALCEKHADEECAP